MKNIELTRAEIGMLEECYRLVRHTPEFVIFQARFNAMVGVRGLKETWGLSPNLRELVYIGHSATLMNLGCRPTVLQRVV